MSHAGREVETGGRDGLRLAAEGLGVCAAVVAGGRVLHLGAREADVGGAMAVLAAVLGLAVLLLAVVLYASGRAGARERLDAIGLRPGWTALREGVVVAVVGLVVLGFLESAIEGAAGVSLWPPDAAPDDEARAALDRLRDHPWWTLALVTAGGAVEEVVYRGWGLLLVRRARPSLTVFALVATSLLFGAAHVLVPVAGFVHFALTGLVFGLAALAAGSVLPAAVVHAGMNAAVMTIVLFGG